MHGSTVEKLVRALSHGPVARRPLARGLAGAAFAAGLTQLGLEDADARRRRGRGKGKGNGKKRRGRNRGGNDRCRFARCDGQCVALDTDESNCGACGATCAEGAVCVGGRCAIAIGSSGDGPQQLSNPTGAAFFDDSLILVVDTDNTRVQGIQGQAIVGRFGGFGSGDGQFLFPFGVAADPGRDRIFVTDVDRNRVQRFAPSGTFQLGTGEVGSGLGEFSSPHGIAFVGRKNDIVIADTGNHSLQLLDANSLIANVRIGGQGKGDGEFNSPLGVALDNVGQLVVADTGNHRIQVLTDDGIFIRSFGRQGSGAGEFNDPVAVAHDTFGNVFVVDRGNHRVQQFSQDGKFRKAFGRQGTGIGEFDSPSGIAINSRNVIAVVDQGNDRVQVFSPASSI
jgi:DNA-binding beta-propeller fold protein YncE